MIKNFIKNIRGLFETKTSVLEQLIQEHSNSLSCSISFSKAIEYYYTIAPLKNAIDIILDEVQSVEPVLYNRSTNEYIYKHPVLNLLKNPNPDLTYSEFIKTFALFYLLCGNSFITMSGLINKEPLELEVINPSLIYGTMSSVDNYVQAYNVSQAVSSICYTRNDAISKSFRYINGDTSELYHVKDVNISKTPFARVPLDCIVYELEQYKSSSIHNDSLLKNGVRSSGILSTNVSLTDDSYRRIEQQLGNKSGSGNAGSLFFFDGGDFDYKELSQTLKDMDFKELKILVSNTIFTKFKIPLPLISPDHMTLSNFKEARVALYEGCVLPLLNTLFEEFNKMLDNRYKLSDSGLVLYYNIDEIPVLETKRADIREKKIKTGAYTYNEVRKMYGDEPLLIGGDELLVPSSLQPIEASINNDSNEEKKEFFRILENQGMSKESIKRLWDEN